MSLNIDAKSVAIGGAAVLAANYLLGGSKKKSTGTAGLGKPGKRKSSGTKKASTKKAGTAKRKTAKRK